MSFTREQRAYAIIGLLLALVSAVATVILVPGVRELVGIGDQDSTESLAREIDGAWRITNHGENYNLEFDVIFEVKTLDLGHGMGDS